MWTSPDCPRRIKWTIRGIVANESEAWVKQRRFGLRTLRDLGFGRRTIEDISSIRSLVHDNVEPRPEVSSNGFQIFPSGIFDIAKFSLILNRKKS